MTEKTDAIPELTPLPAPPEFLAAAAELAIEFDPGDLDRLGLFLAHLLRTNEEFNLTAIRDAREAWEKHLLDSLTLLRVIHSRKAKSVIDVGSGGGLPGMPLALVQPEVRFTLLEATGKKARFLDGARALLKAKNVSVLAERAETAGHDARHRERYDLVVSRAVGPLRVLAELTSPFARVGGAVVAIKGEKAEAEIADAAQALKLLHLALDRTERTPTGTLVILKKTAPTPRHYPRRPGEPKRAPL